MVASIEHDCPHCTTKRIGFTLAAETRFGPPRPKDWMVLYKCNKCQGGLVVEYTFQVNHGYASPSACNVDPGTVGFTPRSFYPGKMPPSTPAFTPEPLDKYFKQAVDAFQNGSPDASGAMCRKVVDVSTQKLLGEDAKKFGTIAKRIDELAARSLLTPDLQKWAHVVRLEGNDASHDEDPYTPEEADELLSFVDLYLTYVYAMPGRLKLRRESAEKEKAEAAAKKK
jgi:hypothetical protein